MPTVVKTLGEGLSGKTPESSIEVGTLVPVNGAGSVNATHTYIMLEELSNHLETKKWT